jgi:hypothetical protein
VRTDRRAHAAAAAAGGFVEQGILAVRVKHTSLLSIRLRY